MAKKHKLHQKASLIKGKNISLLIKMNRLIRWMIILISFAIVLWALWGIERWAGEWKDLFFYQDNWLMYIFLFALALIVGTIIKKFFAREVIVLK